MKRRLGSQIGLAGVLVRPACSKWIQCVSGQEQRAASNYEWPQFCVNKLPLKTRVHSKRKVKKWNVGRELLWLVVPCCGTFKQEEETDRLKKRIEIPEIDPNAYGDLVHDNAGIWNQWGKDISFSSDLGTTGQTFRKYIAGSLPSSFPQK